MEVFLHKKDMPYNCKLCNFRHIEDNFCCVIGDVVPNDSIEKRYNACTIKEIEKELKPKYKMGDLVYFIYYSPKREIVCSNIKAVHIGKTKISYSVKGTNHRYNEDELCWTLDEANKKFNKNNF